MSDYRLDCKGLQCPKPIIQISKKMREMTAGQTLEVEANDPAFPADLAAWLNFERQHAADDRIPATTAGPRRVGESLIDEIGSGLDESLAEQVTALVSEEVAKATWTGCSPHLRLPTAPPPWAWNPTSSSTPGA